MAPDGLDSRLLAQLAAGEARSEHLARALGVPLRTVQYRLAGLRAGGLVVSPRRGAWRLTGAGGRAALVAAIPEPLAGFAALDALPAEHRAYLRLVEDAVVARRALGELYLTNWPGFVLLGPTKTGKTLLGALAARRLGLDPAEAIRLVMLETPGSLLGRRVQEPGGVWHTIPSPLLALPLVVLDEYDKASPELQQAAFAYLAGASDYRSEDAVLEVGATALLTLNAERDPGSLLPDAYLRRSVVLDTTPLVEATADLDETARLLARAALPELSADVAPPGPELPEPDRARLRAILRACLTPAGWGLVDVEALARLALGRWTQAPADPEAAVLAVAADYLLVTATRLTLVAPDWPAQLEEVAGGADGPLRATLAAAHARQADEAAREAVAEGVALTATLALAGTRERLCDALKQAVRSAPRGRELTSTERAAIAAARGKARPLREAIAAARSLEALETLEGHLEREVLDPLQSVASALDGRRAAAAQARRYEAAERHREVVRKQARHAELRALYRQDTTRPGEGVVAALLTARCLDQRTEQYEEETWRSILARGGHRVRSAFSSPPRESVETPEPRPVPFGVSWEWQPTRPQLREPVASSAGPAPVYETKIRTWYEDRVGRRIDPADMVAWGSEAVLAVIQAAAVAEDLPRLTRPRRRRREPTRRASSSSSRGP